MKTTTFPLSPVISIRYRLTFNLKLFWLLGLISILALLVFYVFQVNSLTGQRYLLKKQEGKLAEMKKEKEILEINFSRANSLNHMESYFQNHNFEKADQVKFIELLESSVVAK